VFMEDGNLELDNNRAERSIKPFVIGRKISCSRTHHVERRPVRSRIVWSKRRKRMGYILAGIWSTCSSSYPTSAQRIASHLGICCRGPSAYPMSFEPVDDRPGQGSYYPARIPGRAIVAQPNARNRSRARCSGFDAYLSPVRVVTWLHGLAGCSDSATDATKHHRQKP